ncbi:MAG: site-specific integrase [Oscillospiraceae bacterium]|jgi:integrase|nr:site-specific integrase [Oscillospiraceae bacterium]
MPKMQRNIYKRKDGRFVGNYIKGRDENGKAIYGYVYARNYSDCKAKLEEAKKSVLTSEVKQVQKYTVAKSLEQYLENTKVKYKKTSINIYNRYITNYVEPFFKGISIDELSSQKMQEFINYMFEKNLSVGTVQAVVNFIKKGIKYTVVGDTLSVEMPKKTNRNIEVLTSDEQKILEYTAKVYDDNLYVAVMLCLYLGLRIGEVCGLKWEDISFTESTLQVCRTMERVKDGNETKIELLEPKSRASVRKIPVPAMLIELLKNHKNKTGGEFVLWKNNKFIEPRNLQYHFKKLLKKAELKDINFHSTRHCFVVRALEQGLDIQAISEILGHSSAIVTLRQYAQSVDAHKREQLEILSNIHKLN